MSSLVPYFSGLRVNFQERERERGDKSLVFTAENKGFLTYLVYYRKSLVITLLYPFGFKN